MPHKFKWNSNQIFTYNINVEKYFQVMLGDSETTAGSSIVTSYTLKKI